VTARAATRRLPLRVPIGDGESLDSWLEALARRNGITARTLLTELGWEPPQATSGLLLRAPPAALAKTETACGLVPGRLAGAVLGGYASVTEVRAGGSRYCPKCLAASGGRWPLTWRFPWTFACLTHKALLCDHCPKCGKPPRIWLGDAGLNPAGTCAAPAAARRHCHGDLTASATPAQPVAGRVLAAQLWVDSSLREMEPGRTGQALAELTSVARWMLRHSPHAVLAEYGRDTVTARNSWAGLNPVSAAGRFPPPSAALTAAAAAMAHAVLTGSDDDTVSMIRSLLVPDSPATAIRPAGMPAGHWRRLSRPVQARFLQATDEQMSPPLRIRYRSGTRSAGLPAAPAGQLRDRARAFPQLLWPAWSLRLRPGDQYAWIPFRANLAACLMLPGNPAPTLTEALGDRHARSGFAVNELLRSLDAGGHAAIFAAICCLAGYLDGTGSPVDYQRRREIVPAETVSAADWNDLCCQAGAHPGKGRARLRHAQQFLYQLLTGADLTDSRQQLTLATAASRRRYTEFVDAITTPLREALHRHAAQLLDRLGIDEPLTWEPPATICAHLTLPGTDPAVIDRSAVQEMVIERGQTLGFAADRLGVTIDHIRYAVERVNRPARSWKASTPVAAWHTRRAAEELFTPEFLTEHHAAGGKSLTQLAAETGFGRHIVTSCARRAGITPVRASDPAPIDPRWLRRRYLDDKAGFTRMAAELGVDEATVIAAARRHGIVVRPPGVHSTSAMTTRLPPGIPPDIRSAVEGSIHGWQRLDRFRSAMNYPTVTAAADHLAVDQGTLVRQFRRLEQDIDAQLYHRGARGKPVRPTDRGAALIRNLDRADVRAARASAPGTATTRSG
jgi:hypothetical protein